MARSLVIVESPAKAKTINKYLGKNFTVKASIGHVMDLPTKTIGIRLPIDDEKPKKKKKGKKGAKAAAPKPLRKPITLDDPRIFEPTLQVIPGKGKVVNDLRRAAQKADAVYLAGDPDREGEAISAHLAMVLSKPAKFLIDEADEENGKKSGIGAKDDKAEAEKHAAAARAILEKGDNPQQQQFLPYLAGYVAFYSGDYKTAIAEFQKGNLNDAFIVSMIAQAYEKLGDKDKALDHYQVALGFTSHNPPVAYARPLA